MTEHQAPDAPRFDSLHELLLAVCPPDDKGRTSIPILAGHLGVVFQTIYDRWIKFNRIPAHWTDELLELADGRVTLTDLLPYILKGRDKPE